MEINKLLRNLEKKYGKIGKKITFEKMANKASKSKKKWKIKYIKTILAKKTVVKSK